MFHASGEADVGLIATFILILASSALPLVKVSRAPIITEYNAECKYLATLASEWFSRLYYPHHAFYCINFGW